MILSETSIVVDFPALYQASTDLSLRIRQVISTSMRYVMQCCFGLHAVNPASLRMIISENTSIVDGLAVYQESTDHA